MSDLSHPCWMCGAWHEPGNPTDYNGTARVWECRRCQREIKAPQESTPTERPRHE